MKVVTGYPPNFKEIEKVLGTPPPRAVFAWGDRVYNPSGHHLTGDLIAHEKVHLDQQKVLGVEAWWRRYLDESEFRLDQEAKAYGRQYQFICSTNRNRNYQFDVLQALALMLCGPMYGYCTTMERAMALIRSFA